MYAFSYFCFIYYKQLKIEIDRIIQLFQYNILNLQSRPSKQMFAEFQNMVKKKAQKITKSSPADLLSGITSQADYSKTPQKFTINGREIQQKKLLAQGAFGFIWVAEDINTKQQFALKRVICMTQDKVKSAMLEKSIMEKLPISPYIVKYYGGNVFKYEGNTVIITLMQLCSGGNLFDMLQKRQGKGIPQQTIKQIAHSVLQGLSVLHKVGLIHRDIKIENILVGKDKKMKICDFGSCTRQIIDFSIIPKSEYDHVKQEIQAFTTPMYRPPQIVDPYLKYKVTNKVDLWMLGCILYTMSYFVHPFVEANAVGIAGAVYRFPNYPDETKYKVTPKMQDFIRNFLTPNPEFRPSPQKMLQILNRWDDIPTIPLNQQAKKLKKQHEQKQQQLKKLNQKVSKYDGDIPLEQLMKLQQKLKSNNKQHYQKQTVSFVTNKETKNISQGKVHIYNSQPNNNFSLFQTSTKTNQIKKAPSMPINNIQNKPVAGTGSKVINQDVWSDVFTGNPASFQNKNQSSHPKQSFDAFKDVFSSVSSGKQIYKQQAQQNSVKNNANFFQFFQGTASSNKNTQQQRKMVKKQQKVQGSINLLDL